MNRMTFFLRGPVYGPSATVRLRPSLTSTATLAGSGVTPRRQRRLVAAVFARRALDWPKAGVVLAFTVTLSFMDRAVGNSTLKSGMTGGIAARSIR
jgi:hypothetical protein